MTLEEKVLLIAFFLFFALLLVLHITTDQVFVYTYSVDKVTACPKVIPPVWFLP